MADKAAKSESEVGQFLDIKLSKNEVYSIIKKASSGEMGIKMGTIWAWSALGT